jgi:ComF family protein
LLRRALRAVADGVVGLAYPQECRLCNGPVQSLRDGIACADCWMDPSITRLLIGARVCHKCGAPLDRRTSPATPTPRPPAGDFPPSKNEQADSEGCAPWCAAFPFYCARSCGVYGGAIEAAVLFLKQYPHVCGRLSDLIRLAFETDILSLDADVVVPIPLHPSRERERGYNQAMLIARVLSRNYGLEVEKLALSRVIPTERHRAGLDRIDRARSVENAFAVTRPQIVNGRRLLLVDDVLTTGATISAATCALINAGADRVSVLTAARAAGK